MSISSFEQAQVQEAAAQQNKVASLTEQLQAAQAENELAEAALRVASSTQEESKALSSIELKVSKKDQNEIPKLTNFHSDFNLGPCYRKRKPKPRRV